MLLGAAWTRSGWCRSSSDGGRAAITPACWARRKPVTSSASWRGSWSSDSTVSVRRFADQASSRWPTWPRSTSAWTRRSRTSPVRGAAAAAASASTGREPYLWELEWAAMSGPWPSGGAGCRPCGRTEAVASSTRRTGLRRLRLSALRLPHVWLRAVQRPRAPGARAAARSHPRADRHSRALRPRGRGAAPAVALPGEAPMIRLFPPLAAAWLLVAGCHSIDGACCGTSDCPGGEVCSTTCTSSSSPPGQCPAGLHGGPRLRFQSGVHVHRAQLWLQVNGPGRRRRGHLRVRGRELALVRG